MAGDPSAANARTALAWRRTAIVVVGGCAVIAKLSVSSISVVDGAGLLVGALLGLWVVLESSRRYQGASDARQGQGMRGGRAPFALGLAISLVCLVELGEVLAS